MNDEPLMALICACFHLQSLFMNDEPLMVLICEGIVSAYHYDFSMLLEISLLGKVHF